VRKGKGRGDIFLLDNSSNDEYCRKQNPDIDDLVKNLKMRFPVIPAEAGIQYSQTVTNNLDSGFHRDDGFVKSSRCQARKN
jgi:hypothetical protein